MRAEEGGSFLFLSRDETIPLCVVSPHEPRLADVRSETSTSTSTSEMRMRETHTMKGIEMQHANETTTSNHHRPQARYTTPSPHCEQE